MHNQPDEAILQTDLTFNAVGTQSKPDGSINLQYVEQSTQEIGRDFSKKDTYHVVVVKSTVVPGTTQNTVKPVLEKKSRKHCGTDFGLCMNPEFLRQGSALEDTLNPERIIIGEHDKKSGDTLERLCRNFHGEKIPPMVRTSLSTAELIKYVNNTFLATKICFINAIANLCRKIPNADVTTVANAIGVYNRIGTNVP